MLKIIDIFKFILYRVASLNKLKAFAKRNYEMQPLPSYTETKLLYRLIWNIIKKEKLNSYERCN